jgi:outer membrane protein TolC
LAAEERAATARFATVKADTGLASVERRFEAAEPFLRLVKLAKLIEVERATAQVVDSIREFTHEKFKQGVGSHMEFLQSHSESGVLKTNLAAFATANSRFERICAGLERPQRRHEGPARTSFEACRESK